MFCSLAFWDCYLHSWHHTISPLSWLIAAFPVIDRIPLGPFAWLAVMNARKTGLTSLQHRAN